MCLLRAFEAFRFSKAERGMAASKASRPSRHPGWTATGRYELHVHVLHLRCARDLRLRLAPCGQHSLQGAGGSADLHGS